MQTPRVLAALALGLLLGCAALARAEPPAAAAPTTGAWEYRQETFHADYDRLRELLDAAGADGFELVLISPQETVAIFKRPAVR